MTRLTRALGIAMLAPFVAACAQTTPAPRDSAHDAMQKRGEVAMGVDQYTSVHVFDDLPNGGRIELQRDRSDSAGVNAIRRHLREIVLAFRTGDFSTPAFVHMSTVPGTTVMAERRNLINYHFKELPGGGEVRITTNDPAAISAIHQFLTYQRSEHHAGGREMGGSHRP